MDYPMAIAVAVACGSLVGLYAIYCAHKATDLDRTVRHEEFKLRLNPEHAETMAKIEASRDSEFAKYAYKQKPQIEGSATRIESDN